MIEAPEQRLRKVGIGKKLVEAYIREKGATPGELEESGPHGYKIKVEKKWCEMSADELAHCGETVRLAPSLRDFLDGFLQCEQ